MPAAKNIDPTALIAHRRKGLTNRQIAEKVGCTTLTVRYHLGPDNSGLGRTRQADGRFLPAGRAA